MDKSAIVDHKNGTYTLLYRVSRAALYNISVYHQGIQLDQRSLHTFRWCWPSLVQAILKAFFPFP